jgi:hypothetical protein
MVGGGGSVDVGVGVSVGGTGVKVEVAVDGVKTSKVGVTDGVRLGPGVVVALAGAEVVVDEAVAVPVGVGVASPGARRMAINPAQ